jgi:hypothetical protein
MAKGPRSFDEIIAVLNPAERARIETFSDPNAPVGEAEVSLAEDRDQPGEWRIEYFHEADGYVTIFAGPMAQQRASLLRRAQIRGSEDHAGGPQRWLTPPDSQSRAAIAIFGGMKSPKKKPIAAKIRNWRVAALRH